MATIIPFQKCEPGFDDELTGVMGDAFDGACAELQDGHLSGMVREIIAKLIIAATEKGERDPIRLRNKALAALGNDRQTAG